MRKMKEFFSAIVHTVAKFVICVVVLAGGLHVFQQHEATLFPVVEGFQIYSVEVNPKGNIVLYGTMKKTRQCEFLELSVFATYDNERIKTPLAVEFLDVGAKSRPAIYQSFGPWIVNTNGFSYDAVKLDFYTRHRCHALWETESHLYTEYVKWEH